MSSSAALSYHEPGIVTILVLSSFLIVENVINWVFDRLLFCGLIGQIAVGVAWGTPGGKWLSGEVETAIVQLGYLGLILLVFEGGLSTDLKTLKSNLFLSSIVALIGISVPIGLSFALQGFMNIDQVQAFAAGAALCSTSLGTTFTILSTSGLSTSRLGVVLSSAAMMDDVVGLVMSGIISSLGKSSDFSATTVVRPVLVSVAFAVILPLICLFIAKPITTLAYRFVASRQEDKLYQLLRTEGAAITFHTLVLVALVTGASYAGTSVLFAAYLAGASSTWWDNLVLECIQVEEPSGQQDTNQLSPSQGKGKAKVSPPANSKGPTASSSGSNSPQETTQNGTIEPDDQPKEPESPVASDKLNFMRGTEVFEKYYHQALQLILKPFFFASIGFAIPISRMFERPIVWKGIVYSIMMIFAKLLCGFCLLPYRGPSKFFAVLKQYLPSSLSGCWPLSRGSNKVRTSPSTQTSRPNAAAASTSQPAQQQTEKSPRTSSQPKQPVSLYPAALLGSAMVARGEIGFLISSVAESDGVFGTKDNDGSSELFLVVTWAILLCTLLGPITVGLMVKRVKRLQAIERSQRTGRADPLGAWGIVPSH